MAIVVNLGILSLSTLSFGQAWSTMLNPTRATDWTSAGFTIPNYTVPCATQPTLQTGAGNASANTTAIQNALASCNASHNVVNLPAGTYYVAGIGSNGKSNFVIRGAGPNSTYLNFTAGVGCRLSSGGANICFDTTSSQYSGSGNVMPPNGSNQCMWTAGYAQGSTTLTFNSCGGPPSTGQIIMLDQANDSGADTGGIFICDSFTTAVNCTGKNEAAQNANGRIIGGVDYSEQQAVVAASVSGSGSGPYTVTIPSPGVMFNNIRSSQSPGAWFFPYMTLAGIENVTADYSNNTSTGVGISFDACYHCWMRNVRSINAARDHAQDISSVGTVYRDSYFYQSQSHGSESYTISPLESSNGLIENNIFQQVNNPIIFSQGSGYVVGYNLSVGNPGINYMQASYSAHNAGSGMNLWEGNSFNAIFCDDVWGSSTTQTYYRNLLSGWQNGYAQQTIPIIVNAYCRGFNAIGNVLGQPGYHTHYQAFATSSTVVNGGSSANNSVYEVGTSDTGGIGNCNVWPTCDTVAYSTFMRWGNYDVVNAAAQWNSSEAAPGSVNYVSPNFSTSYFGSLSHTLPPSLYLSGKPTWWRSMPFPAIGPDVSSGNLGVCTGTYSGAAANGSSQCSGGNLSTAWAGHANAIPAQDCYLNVMNGPPDGSGGVLSFDASSCYNSQTGTTVQPPSGLTAFVQ